VEVTKGPWLHNTCATLGGDTVFTVPDRLLHATGGAAYTDTLAVLGVSLSSKNFLDLQITGDVGFTITTTVTAGNGSISPLSPTFVPANGSYTGIYQAAPGWHVLSAVDNSTTLPVNPTNKTPVSYANLISPVTANHTIKVAFEINKYTVTTVPAPGDTSAKGTITLDRSLVDSNGSFTATVAANNGYHISDVTLSDRTPSGFTHKDQPTQYEDQWTHTFTGIKNDLTITATFDVDYYSLTVTSGTGGTVATENLPATTPYPGYYVNQTAFRLRALSLPGNHFTGWTVLTNGTITTTEGANPLDVTLDADKQFTATFASNVSATVTVGTLTDEDDTSDGVVSLREAINQVNANPGDDAIVIPDGLSGTILLTKPLPILTDNVTISGPTGADGTPLVTIRPGPGFAPNPALPDGFELSGLFLSYGYTPQNTTVKNLIITGFDGAGICVGSDNNTIQGCIIHDNGGDGICIEGGSGNTIGGTLPVQRNLIYHNGLATPTGKGSGVSVRQVAGATGYPVNNRILGNSMYGNGLLGIDLGGNGKVTWNHFPEVSATVNHGQNFPDLKRAAVAGINPLAQPSWVEGRLYSHSGKSYRIEIFKNATVGAAGTGRASTSPRDKRATTGEVINVVAIAMKTIIAKSGRSIPVGSPGTPAGCRSGNCSPAWSLDGSVLGTPPPFSHAESLGTPGGSQIQILACLQCHGWCS